MREIPMLQTQRCKLRISTIDDSKWLYQLFVDEDVKKYIDGLEIFSKDEKAVRRFILVMLNNWYKGLGCLWSIEYNNQGVGFILVYDLQENPFLSFAILKQFRKQHFATETVACVYEYLKSRKYVPRVETRNLIAEKIVLNISRV